MKLINLVKHSNVASITELCNLTGFYYKKLERTFNSATGYSPKAFVRVVRFYRSLREIKHAATSLTDVGLSAGYYDQSHFIHDFRQFTGTTPAKFISQQAFISKLLLKSNYV
jgi:AraC-like DNA-binding protein